MAAIAPGIEIVTSPAELGAAIRRARTELGLSYRDAAALCRVGRRFFNELENGKPTARLDKTLAVMIGVGLLPLIVPYQAAMQALGK
jgi:transcriptional regulator with XRE-family HTH domain